MSDTFQNDVLEKLSSIETRLSSIEEKFEEATSFADSLVDGESGIFGGEGLNSIKDTLSTFLSPQLAGQEVADSGVDTESLQDLVGSLKSFKERLSGIKEAISDLPEDPVSSVDE
jgi:hypothetical protein